MPPVGTLLYWIEYHIQKREEKSCNSGPNQWLEPKGIKQVPYLELGSNDFTSANKSMYEFYKGNFERDSIEKSVVSHKTQSTVEEHIVQLFEKCSSSEKVPILFSIEDQPYCKSFSESAAHLPLALQSLFDPAHLEHNYVELVEVDGNMHRILDVIPFQQSHLEKLTHGQARSRLWMRYRSGRITASHLFQVVLTDPYKPALSLVCSICYPESVNFTSAATQYGCEHECKAVDAYKLR